MDPVDAYLDELASHLDCDPLRRDEIRLEAHCHLRELVEHHRSSGMDPAEAAGAAIREFGPAVEVARRLSAVNTCRIPRTIRVSVRRRAAGLLLGGIASTVALAALILLGLWLAQVPVEQVESERFAFHVFWVSLLSYVVAGAVAALVVWAVSGQMWDTVILCVAMDLAIAFAPPTDRDTTILSLVLVAPMLVVGVALAALVLRGWRGRPAQLRQVA